MKSNEIEILKQELGLELSKEKVALFILYKEKFLEKNAHTNLISKNDEKFLFEKLDAGEIRLVFKNDYRARIVYHIPCHMEKLGWSIFTEELIRMIPGVSLTVLDSGCCGIAGTYGFKKENYASSQAIGKPVFDQIYALSPDFVCSECETCKWQIEMSTAYKVFNPIVILADALDLEATAAANQPR
mgnify:CR=1 FL=1